MPKSQTKHSRVSRVSRTNTLRGKKQKLKRFELPVWMIEVNDETFPYDEDAFRTLWEDIKSVFGFYQDEDTEDWIRPRNQVLQTIRDLITDDRVLSVGTKLYHGTMNCKFDTDKLRDEMTFMGLEPVISMWYTNEENNYRSYGFGCVYEFEVIRPIPITKLIEPVTSHPRDFSNRVCRDVENKSVCIHPQITFHSGSENPPYEISVELTVPLRQLLDEGYLRMVQRFRTSIKNLEHMSRYPLYRLNVWQYEDILFFWPKHAKLPENTEQYLSAPK